MNVPPAIWSEVDLDHALDEFRAATAVTERSVPALRTRVLADMGRMARSGGAADREVARPRVLTAANVAPRPRRRSRIALTVAAVVVAVTGVAVVSTTSVGHRPAGASADADAVLNAAAGALAGHAGDPVIGPGQFLLRTEHDWEASLATSNDPPIAYLSEERRRTWIPADRNRAWLRQDGNTGRYRFLLGTPEQASAAGLFPIDTRTKTRRARCGDFDVPVAQTCRTAGTWQNPTGAWLAQLPRDPNTLYRQVKSDAPRVGRGGAELFTYLTDALRTGMVPADLRASFYRVMTRLPGLTVTERTANLDGRRGTALGIDDGTALDEVIIDPTTGTFVGERVRTTAASSDGLPAGSVLSFTAVDQAVVDHAGP